jgi:hypothetical protein
MDEFKQLVSGMRRMQNKYYATKDKKFLIAAKAAERQVDQALQADGYNTVSPEDRQNQQKLF